METDSLPTEIILTYPQQTLGKIKLDWTPQPGNYLNLEGKTYAVLERHHHYKYQVGGYFLDKVSLYVQCANQPGETTYLEGRLVVGDASCRYSAHSEIIRCAVHPEGPCEGCRDYEAREIRGCLFKG